jgi:hypothetical protein
MRSVLIFFAMAFLTAGCHRSFLSVRSEYLTPQDLASERIITPDPSRDCFFGQQLVIHWNLPAPCFLRDKTILAISIRYKNLETERKDFFLPTSRGFLTLKFINEAYWLKGGVLSFKVEVFNQEELLDCWVHHVWADLIEL